MKRLLTFSTGFLLLSISANATHLLGGTFSYKFLNSTNDSISYLITLELYRDAENSTVIFDQKIQIGIYHNNDEKDIYQKAQFDLTSKVLLFDHCNFSDANIEVGYYKKSLTLPASSVGYYLTFVRCCRTYVDNLESSGPNGQPFQGFTFITFIPPTVYHNNSPEYYFAPNMLNKAKTKSLDYGAMDIDGDSLVYEIVTPYQGGLPTYPGSMPEPTPKFIFPSRITYSIGYGPSNPLGDLGSVIIDRFTGLLNYYNASLGSFDFSIETREFRKGVLIGIHRRDYPLIFINAAKTIEIYVNNLRLNHPFLTNRTSVTLNWQICQNKISKFIVERKEKNLNWRVIGETKSREGFYDTISMGVKYYYRIIAAIDTLLIISNIDSVYTHPLAVNSPTITKNSIHPNPFDDQIQIDLNELTVPVTLKVYNQFGVLVLQDVIITKSQNIYTNQLTNGIYYLELLENGNNTFRQLFFKQNK